MLPWFLLLLTSARGLLARILGLRWARSDGFDLAVPAAIAVVIGCAVPQLGRDIAGVPFGVAWAVATAAIVAPVLLLTRRPRPAASSAGAGASSAAIGTPCPSGFGGPGSVGGPESVGGPKGSSAVGLTLVVGIVVAWVLYDILYWSQTIHLYDLDVYLGSASRWLDGGQPYMTAVATTWPTSARADFFLYPPPFLPVFAALSRLPQGPVAAGWVVLLVACSYKAYRYLGLPRTWSVALLAFPPVAIGFESGNVASLAFLLFVASFRVGGTLVIDGLLKVQAGLPALWLVRQRRWRAIVAGVLVLAAIVLVTLPFVGLDSWRAWWNGLGFRAASQAVVPAMYGYSYAGVLPAAAFIAIAAAFVGLALLFRGRSGLAAFGLASIIASPSLWPHGFVFALPGLLMLENGAAVWLVLGAGAFGPNMWILFGAAWVAVAAARRLPSGALHPLAGTDGPWPNPPGRHPMRSIPLTARMSAARKGG
ncbi:MAG: glycosyltransferase family 87 protein [Candidatus Limnocylindrales bacterium]